MNIDTFKHYIGKSVSVNETPYELKLKSGTHRGMNYKLEDVNLVIDEIRKEAVDKGMELRIFLPSTMGTCDYIDNRLNVSIAKKDDGSFHITDVSLG